MLTLLLTCLLGWYARGAMAAPFHHGGGSHSLNKSQMGQQSLSKRFFSSSTGWGPGGHSVADNDDRIRESTTAMFDRMNIPYDRDGRISNCATCETTLRKLQEALKHSDLDELTDEDERLMLDLIDALRKWKEARLQAANSRSKRSIKAAATKSRTLIRRIRHLKSKKIT
jgi:hypothetical protein